MKIHHLMVTELSGRLRASDMDAVANNAAIAIAKLADKDLATLPTDGWAVQTSPSERRPAITPQANREEPATA